MRNKHPGRCACGTQVAVGEGYFEKQAPGSWPRWKTRCMLCVAVGKEAKGALLTPPQTAALIAARKEGRAP